MHMSNARTYQGDRAVEGWGLAQIKPYPTRDDSVNIEVVRPTNLNWTLLDLKSEGAIRW